MPDNLQVFLLRIDIQFFLLQIGDHPAAAAQQAGQASAPGADFAFAAGRLPSDLIDLCTLQPPRGPRAPALEYCTVQPQSCTR